MINTQVLKGNLIRQDYTMAFTLSQGDKGVPFKVELLENGTPYTLLPDDVVTIEWLKPNGNPFLQEGDISYGSTYIEFTTPEAIAQYSGSGSFNIIISNSDVRKGTIRREYKVVPTSMKPGSVSEDTITDAITELRELNSTLAATIQTGDLDNYAKKTYVNKEVELINSSLEEMANDYAKKTEVNELASNKANQVDLNATNVNVSKNTTDIATQSARIDTFTNLSSGSTTGDAELLDARIVNGTTYTNVGGAIRAVSSGEALGDGSITVKKFDNDLNTCFDFGLECGVNKVNTNDFKDVLFEDFYTNANGITFTLEEGIKLENNKYYQFNVVFEDGFTLNANDTMTRFKQDDTILFYKALNNAVYSGENGELVNNVQVYFNATAVTDCTGKTIKYMQLVENNSDNLSKFNAYYTKLISNTVNGVISSVEKTMDDNKYVFGLVSNSENLFNKYTALEGFYLNAGVITAYTDNTKSVTEYLDIENVTTLYIYPVGTRNVALYDADKVKIATTQIYGSKDISSYSAKYIVVEFATTDIDTLMVSTTELYKYTPYKYVEKEKIKGYSGKFINFWEGKVGDSLGDSITAQGHFQDYVKRYFNLKYFYNHGIGGSKLAGDDALVNGSYLKSMWTDERIDALNSDADFITIMGGTNDGDVEVGEAVRTNFDTDTYIGAYNTIIKKIYTKYSGDIMLFLMTPTYTGANTARIENQAQATITVGKLWGIPVVDLYHNAQMNEYTAELDFPEEETNRIHPSKEGGHKKMARVIIGKMKEHEPIELI